MKNMILIISSLILVSCASAPHDESVPYDENREPAQVTTNYGKLATSKPLTLYSKDGGSTLTMIAANSKGLIFKLFMVNGKGHMGEISGIRTALGEEVTTTLDGVDNGSCDVSAVMSTFKDKKGGKKLRVDLSQTGVCEGMGLGVYANGTFKEK